MQKKYEKEYSKKMEKINNTTWKVKQSKWAEVEIGNIEKAAFEPQIKLKRWGDECWIGDEAADSEAYLAYMKQRHSHDPNAKYIVNTCPRAFLPTDDRLYLWCLAWTSKVVRLKQLVDCPKDWQGRIFWTSSLKCSGVV